MSFLKTGLVFGLIKKVIVAVFKAVYAVLSFFNLHLTVLVGLVGLVLFLTGTFDKYPTVRAGFYIAIIASVIVAIIITIKKLLGLSDKKRKRKGVEIMNTDSEGNSEKEGNAVVLKTGETSGPIFAHKESAQNERIAGTGFPVGNANAEDFGLSVPERPKNFPVYYEVKQNRNYIMAEYADRYELYFKDRNGLRKIRTDLKQKNVERTENKW